MGAEKEGRGGLKGMGRKGRLGEGKKSEGSGERGVCPLPPSPGYATGCYCVYVAALTLP